MCGIIAYIGNKPAREILLEGLKALEYRGYDSSGMAILNGSISICKAVGGVDSLAEKSKSFKLDGTVGMAHTRWATHGKVTENNAHPHLSASGKWAIVHNGIIENQGVVRAQLEYNGYSFSSDTDTEVLLNYIEQECGKGRSVPEVMVRVEENLEGNYAYVLMDRESPDQLWCMRKGAPLVVGLGDDELFVASDPSAFGNRASHCFFPEHNQAILLTKGEQPKAFGKGGRLPDPLPMPMMQIADTTRKNEHKHFMLKEICEQPEILERNLRLDRESLLNDFGRVVSDKVPGGRIVILACGTSLHAGMVGRYMIEKYAGVPVVVEQASEFRYRKPVVWPGDLVIGVSQSGETADTLAAIRYVKKKNATVVGLCNVAHSSMAQECDALILLDAGPEIGVASTKAFFAQVIQFIRLTVFLSKDATLRDALMADIPALSVHLRQLIDQKSEIEALACQYASTGHFLYLGRGIHYPLALEGALKLKEIAYVHAEGYPAAEMKHGPIALIEELFPVIAIANDQENRTKMATGIQEINSRNGQVIALATEGDTLIASEARHPLFIPASHEMLLPLLTVIPLQLFAYYMALARGCNVDRPRNLAKSVTVE